MKKKIIITLVNPVNNAVSEFPVYGDSEHQVVSRAIEHVTFIQNINPLVQAQFNAFQEEHTWVGAELSEESLERLLNEGT